MSNNNDNGWNEYSNLVLHELEILGRSINNLNSTVQEIKQELAVIRSREDRVQELTDWKRRVDDVASPSQLNQLKKEVDDLKHFKTRAITIFAVVQFAMGLILFFDKLF